MVSLSAPGTDRARAILAIDILLLILPYPFVALRFWSRWRTQARPAINDYLIIAALIVTTGFNVNIVLVSVYGGYGQHVANVTSSELAWFSKAAVVSTVTWPTANALIKLSILHFYTAIFSVNRKMVMASYAIAGLTLCYWVATFVTAFTICTPFAYNWNKEIQGSCGAVLKYYLSTAIVNLLIDVMIVILPLPSVWMLHMATSRKLALTFIFGLGAGICAVSIVRVYSIANLDELDITYNIVLDNITTTLEPVLGIVNACLPILQPVASVIYASKMFSSLRSLISRSSLDRQGSATQHKDSEYSSSMDPDASARKRFRHANDLTTSLRRDDDDDDFPMTEYGSSVPNKDASSHSTV